MAEYDFFAGLSARNTDAGTAVDLTGYIGQAFLIAADGTPVTGITLEEQLEGGGAFTAIAAADLLYSDNAGNELQGVPADGLIQNEPAYIRYRGVGVAIRGSATGASVIVVRGCPARNANVDNAITAV